MSKASKRLITFYKSKVLIPIFERNNALITQCDIDVLGFGEMTKSETDMYLKEYAQIEKSCSVMTSEELQELIVWSFVVGDSLGLDLDYKHDELDKLIQLNLG